ncbi:proprotein convertase subtilisin/kexin type 5 [Trichomycterus rosablanca]|uniref:proprotein convertase subtilisin/kexin type 5 n=1 Tax=Trichomycterus rosablanca TaxID=2290929 RepID=UPI002F360D3E
MPFNVKPSAVPFQFWLYFTIILPLCHANLFTNHWAVKITGGQKHADQIAEKYGFLNVGQIGGLRHHYHFFHQGTIKRSTIASRGNHSLITTESKVKWIQQQMVHKRMKRISKATEAVFNFNDPQWHSSWYINCDQNCLTDMNIKAAWRRGYTGKGVVVTILDDGVERQHPDLKQNYDAQASHDVNGNDPDPTPRYNPTNENRHGTRCAGVVASAANNSLCTVGIAYNARIGGIRMLDGDMTDVVEAKSLSLRQHYIDIYSSSWGPEDDGRTLEGPGPLAKLALRNGIRKGRKGRGSIFVWASGNGGRSQDHCSCDGYTNSIYTIAVSSTTISGHKPWYLEECSSTLATTYSSGESLGIVTTDLKQRCTTEHSGTSASAPMAAGIIALTLEANPLLTWRDVQHIIVKTSSHGHLTAPDWHKNGAGNYVSHLYGFGLMDAEAMVKEAEIWRQVPAQHVCEESTVQNPRVISPERKVRLVFMSSGCSAEPARHVVYLEHVILRITITHPHRGDLSITLTSPSGTKSQLLATRPNDYSPEGFVKWEFMTTHCWGEKAVGEWMLEIRDTPSKRRNTRVHGKLVEWTLVLYGTSTHPYKRHEQPRSAVISSDEDNIEEYNSSCDTECSEDGCDGPGPHQCISCLHYYLKFRNGTRTCVRQCPQGFWGDRKRCKKCYSTCEACTGSRSDQCSSCKTAYHMDEETSSCVTSCGDGYYLNHDNNVCSKCNENCVKCTSFDICTECPKNTSLVGNKCQKNCEPGTFYNQQNDACEACHAACYSCSAADPDSCILCADGYLMEDWRCVSSCSEGFYPTQFMPDGTGQMQSSCRRCDASCKGCAGPGKQNCSDCVDGLTLQDGVCVLKHDCGDGEYQDSHGKCNSCESTCQKCKGPKLDDCIMCPASRWLDEGRCILHCPVGKYLCDRQCHACDHTCAQCLDAGPAKCTSCNKDRFGQDRYLYKGQCVTACPNAHFHSSLNTCEPCPEHCILCSSVTQCLKCNSSYYVNNGACSPLECGEGEVEDPEYDDCMACEEGCKKCVLYNPKHCLSCTDGYYKYEEGCYKHCPAKTYAVEHTMSCVACKHDCVSCDEEECHWCEADLFLSNGKCVQECPDGFYGDEDTQECESCHADCRSCTGPGDDECVSCQEGLVLVDSECITEQDTCPAKTYLNDDGKCEMCHPSCEMCWGRLKNQCTSCVTGRYLSTEQLCVTRCPAGSFGSTETGQCEACPQGCAQCLNEERCTRCISSRKNTFYLQDGQCVRQCSRGYYPAGLVCRSCTQGCILCSEEGNCAKCNGSFLHEARCVSMCPDGFYKDIQQGVCGRCHLDCELCHGPGHNNCDTCTNPDSTLTSGECVPPCPSHTYRDTRSEECMVCHGTCQTCSGPLDTDCTSCSASLWTDVHGRCSIPTNCPLHHYSDLDGRCHLCHKHCHHCSGPYQNQCLGCSSNLYMLNSTCVDECPTGFFKGETQKCEPCHPNCLSCTGRHSHECLSCRAYLYREGKECVETCQPGHYADEYTRMCERCEKSCTECTQSEGCVSCREEMVLLKKQNQCVSSCPIQHFHDTLYNTCEPCHATCRTCTGSHIHDCTSCHLGYTLSDGTCDLTCVMGEYFAPEEQVYNCKPCDKSCLECKGAGPDNCTSCSAQFILTSSERCLPCCTNQGTAEEDATAEKQDCCNCTHTRGECVLSTNFAFRNHEEEKHPGNLTLFIITSIMLVIGLSAVALFIARSFSKRPTPDTAVARGYEKLSHNAGRNDYSGGMNLSSSSSSSKYKDLASSSSGYLHEEQLVDLDVRRTGQNDDEDEEDEDIVYMGQDGTVYRRFRYGQLEEDQLEYDDESYNYR